MNRFVPLAARLVAGMAFLFLSVGHAGTPTRAHVSEDVVHALKSGPVRVIVTLDVAPTRDLARTRDAVRTAQQRVLQGLPPGAVRPVAEFSHLPLLTLELPYQALDALSAQPGVRAVNLDRERRLFDAESAALTRIGDVHSSGFSGAGTRVAVIDSGINQTHVNLADDLFAQACFRTEGDCPVGANDATDQDGHGTHVSGTITGAGGNAPDAEIIALKVFTTGSTSDTNILNALNAIVANHATWQTNVVNMSLGGGNYSDRASCDADSASYVTAFSQLNALGIAVFVATGNDAQTTQVSSPGCVTGAIGVGSISDAVFTASFSNCTENGQADKVTCFSNATSDQNDATELVDVLAPGCRITAEWIGSTTAMDTICGTSMATPTAAGVAASLLSLDPTLAPADIETLLESTGDLVEDYRLPGVEFPRVNAASAFAAMAITLPTPTGLTATVVSPTQVDLEWNDIDGEDEYEIQRSVAGGAWTTLGAVAQDVVVASDTAAACGQLRYRVRGVEAGATGYSLWSNEASAEARACPVAPALSAVVVDSATVDLDWTSSGPDVEQYELELSIDGGAWSSLDTVPAPGLSYTHDGFACGGFDYRVRAFDSALSDHSAWSNTASANPCAPANDLVVNAEAIAGDRVDEEAEVRYATVSAGDPAPSCRWGGADPGSNSVWYAISPVDDVSVTISTETSDLVPDGGDSGYNDTILAIYTGTPGSFTEVACNEDISNSNYLSRISNFVMQAGETYHVLVTRWSSVPMSWDGALRTAFTFSPAPPVLSASPVAGGVELSWIPTAGATEHRLERKAWNSATWSEIAIVADPDTTHTDLIACEVYDYRVRALVDAVLTPYSEVVRSEPQGCNLAPANDLFANAEQVTGTSYTDVEPGVRYASRESQDPVFAAQAPVCSTDFFPTSGSNTVWYRFTPPVDGMLDADTEGSTTGSGTLDTVIAIYTGSYPALTQVWCDDEGGTGSSSAIVDFPVEGGTTYYMHVARWSDTPTTSATVAYTVNFSYEATAAGPAAFDLLAPTDGTSTELPDVPSAFDWEDASGADSYTLTINDGSSDLIVESGIASSDFVLDAQAQSLLGAGTYDWTVAAHNTDFATTAANGPFSFTVLAPPPPPGEFALLSPDDGARYLAPDAPGSFSWEASDGADSYMLTVNGAGGEVFSVDNISTTSYAVDEAGAGLLVPGAYTWTVTAVNQSGNTGAAATFGFVVEDELIMRDGFEDTPDL